MICAIFRWFVQCTIIQFTIYFHSIYLLAQGSGGEDAMIDINVSPNIEQPIKRDEEVEMIEKAGECIIQSHRAL